MSKFKELFLANKSVFIFVIFFLIIGGGSSALLLHNKRLNNNDCIVQFDVSGGSFIDNKVITCGTKVDIPEEPIKNGFKFINWYSNGEVFDFNNVINNNIVLTAKWENDGTSEIVIVSFDSDGGSSVDSIEVAKGSLITEPITPIKSGYSFRGWYYNDDLFDFNFVINEDMLLVAHWEKGEGNNIENSRNTKTVVSENNVVLDTTKNDDLTEDEINSTISNLKGEWYYDDDLDNYVYITGYDTYVLGKKALELYWSNIDLYKGVIYPKVSTAASIYIYYPIDGNNLKSVLKNLNITYVSSNKLVVNNKWNFSRNKKSVDLSQFDKYLGTWYKISGEGNDVVEITKEKDHDSYYFRIGYNTAEYIDNTKIANKTTVFDKYTSWSGSNLKIEKGLYSRNKEDVPIQLLNFNITLENNNCSVGDSLKAYMNPYPTNATDITGTWKSSDNSVATVDKNGNINCLKKGNVTISFTSNDMKESRETYLTVNNVDINKIIIDASDINLKVGEEKTVSYTIEPSNATFKELEGSVSQFDIISAKINSSNNTITFKGIGEGKVKFSLEQKGKYTYLASININVESIPVSSITLNKSEVSIYKDDYFNLSYTIEPSNATYKDVVWKSSNEKVATVSSKGVIKGIGRGKAVISATTNNGTITTLCNVEVNTKPLRGNGSILQHKTCINDYCNNYVYIRLYAYDGYPTYKYSYKLYNGNNEVVSSIENSYSDQFDYKFSKKDTFRLEYTITDLDGSVVSGEDGPKEINPL